MRKVLLTTTALVALGGVSAASALDISGGYEWNWASADDGAAETAGSNDTSMYNDARISFSGESTTDSGLTFGGAYALSHGGTVEDQGLYISGDFGYVMAGATDGVVDGMDNFMSFNNANPEAGGATTNSAAAGLNSTAMVTDGATNMKVGYRSPEVSGFQAGVSYEDVGTAAANDNTAWMVTYDFGVAKVGYASAKQPSATDAGDETTQSHYGIGSTIGGITLSYSVGTDTTSTSGTDTSKIDTKDFGAMYSLNDAATVYFAGLDSEEKTGDNAGDKLNSQMYGLWYTIAPGVSSYIEYATADYTDATSGGTNSDKLDTTTIGLSVSF
jgi:hypothetical protein